MAKNPPDERLAYLALKAVFRGDKAKFRKEKNVCQLIHHHRNDFSVRSLIEEHTIESLCHVAKGLLKDQIFESTLKAKIRFPEVFEVSPAQTAERAISESKAARNEDAAIQHMMGDQEIEFEENTGGIVEPESHATNTNCLQTTSAATSLYPVYLPFDIQHRLLVRVQQKLEQACYAFVQDKLGGVLQREGWDCAEAVELNRWPKIFLTYEDEFHPDDLGNIAKPLPDLLKSVTQLRHAAVHRLRMTANRVLQFIVDAELLISLFQNHDFIRIMSIIRRQTQCTIEDLERNKDMLELRQVEIRKRFSAKRAELDLQEREAVQSMVKEDREYAFFAGMNLEQSLLAPAKVIHIQSFTEAGSSSGTEFDECSIDEAEASREYAN